MLTETKRLQLAFSIPHRVIQATHLPERQLKRVPARRCPADLATV